MIHLYRQTETSYQAGLYYFVVKADNGKQNFRSELYTTKNGAKIGMVTLRRALGVQNPSILIETIDYIDHTRNKKASALTPAIK